MTSELEENDARPGYNEIIGEMEKVWRKLTFRSDECSVSYDMGVQYSRYRADVGRKTLPNQSI